MKNLSLFFLSVSLLTIPVQASGGGGGGGGGGSFRGGGGGSGFSEREPRKVNAERFQQGEALFKGEVDTSKKASLSSRRTQSRDLTTLKQKLAKTSKEASENINVEKLSGRLDANQMRALRYFLDVKFLKKKDYDSSFNKKKGKEEE